MLKNDQTNQQSGFNILGLIVLLAIVPLIAWTVNTMISRDFSEPSNKSFTKQETKSTDVVQDQTPVIPTTTPTIVIDTIKATTTKTTAVPVAPSSDNTVTLTDNGFSPKSITISKGESITFVNNSSKKMWVAANPFPSSSEYPDFNEKVGIENGDSWTFTFTKVGTWFYHNHYSPATGAKVVVSYK